MMKETNIFVPCEPSIGDVVVDTDYVIISLPNLHDGQTYSQRFNLLDILALFSFSEALVLHERLITRNVWDGMDKFERMGDVLSLVKQGIIRYHPETDVGLVGGADTESQQIWEKIAGDIEVMCPDDWAGWDFTLAVSLRRARWSQSQGVDHLAWPAFGVLPRAAFAQSAESLIHKLYQDLRGSLKGKVAELQGVGCPIPMYVPPIPAIVLDRCKGDIGQFLNETLVLREEMRPFREKYHDYQSLVGDPGNRTLGELSQSYQDAVADVSRELGRQGSKRTDSKLIYDIWDAVCEVGTGGDLGDPKATVGLNLGALLSKGVRGLQILRIRARARSLFDLSKKVMEIRRYGELVTSTFGIDANRLHDSLAAAKRLADNCDSIASVKRGEQWGALNLQP